MQNHIQAVQTAVATFHAAKALAEKRFREAMEAARKQYMEDCANATQSPADIEWPSRKSSDLLERTSLQSRIAAIPGHGEK